MSYSNNAAPKISAKIDRMVDNGESRVKAIASVYIADAFCIHGVKVVDSTRGLFVQMPQTSYEKNGKKQYSDQFHAITADARESLNHAVMDAYELKLGDAMTRGQEGLPFGMQL